MWFLVWAPSLFLRTHSLKRCSISRRSFILWLPASSSAALLSPSSLNAGFVLPRTTWALLLARTTTTILFSARTPQSRVRTPTTTTAPTPGLRVPSSRIMMSNSVLSLPKTPAPRGSAMSCPGLPDPLTKLALPNRTSCIHAASCRSVELVLRSDLVHCALLSLLRHDGDVTDHLSDDLLRTITFFIP